MWSPPLVWSGLLDFSHEDGGGDESALDGGVSRRDVLRVAGLVLAAGLLLTACTSTQEPPPVALRSWSTHPPNTQEMPHRRAKAQLAGDERAYLADLDENNHELIQRERMVFENLRQFPVEDLRYLVVRDPGSEFEPPPPPPRQGEDHSRWENWRPPARGVCPGGRGGDAGHRRRAGLGGGSG